LKKALTPLVSTLPSVNLGPSGQASLTISGGNPPYRISQNPDPTLATAQLSNQTNGTGTLVITAAANVATPGTTSIKIKDTDSDEGAPDSPTHNEQEITIVINVSAVPIPVANPVVVQVSSGQTVPVQISGGTPPYQIVTPPNATYASAGFVNPNANPTTLNITGVTNASVAGSTYVKIKGSASSSIDTLRIPITKVP
jgi:hypothetical protein